jgi:TolA-binding protein
MIIRILIALVLAGMGLWAQPPAQQGRALEKLRRMAPEERERALQDMPPARRRMMEQRLDRWNRMAPARKQRLQGSFENFRQMRPEQQENLRSLVRKFNETMPAEKRVDGRRALTHLRKLDPEARKKFLASPRMKDRFNDSERELLAEMAENMPD